MTRRPSSRSSRRRPRPPAKQRPESGARLIALSSLQAFRDRGAFLAPSIDGFARKYGASPEDRALATELACGVLRRRATLDSILSAYTKRPQSQTDPNLWTLLQLGCFQVLFLRRIPDHAAVHETVSLCRTLRRPQWTSYANGVLRTIVRERPGEPIDLPPFSECTPRTLPLPIHAADVVAPKAYVFERNLLPRPNVDPAGYVAQATSLPRWLVHRWLTALTPPHLGEVESGEQSTPEALMQAGLWFATPGRVSLRVNPLKATTEQVRALLEEAGSNTEPGMFPEAIRLAGTFGVEGIPQFAEGWFSVQDESAMSAVDLLDPQPGESILDLCAAPGGKTAHLCERMRNTGRVVATDIDDDRLGKVKSAIERLGLSIATCERVAPDASDVPDGPFDAILVDVPCSNTGVLGKRPEARWRLEPSSFDELVPRQRMLLSTALDRVADQGRVVYSTCSIEPAENEQVVRDVLASRGEFEVVQERHHVPGRPVDGGYQALIRKRAQTA